MEFMFGRPLSPEELELIRSQIEPMDDITAVSDEVRGIVESELAAPRLKASARGQVMAAIDRAA
jgi:hypothetical protein